MADSTYLANKLLDHVMNGTTFTPGATLYLALYESGVEVTGGNYSRLAVTRNTTNFPAASSGAMTNGVDLDFATPSASWGTVDEVRVMDASSGGNTWKTASLATPKTINSGDPVSFPAGDLDLTHA